MPKEYQGVVAAPGKKGDYKDNVLKINVPRDDLKITVDGVATPTPFGFGGWLAMARGSGGQTVMMGDLVLLQEEVNPVMSAMRCTTISSSKNRGSSTCTRWAWNAGSARKTSETRPGSDQSYTAAQGRRRSRRPARGQFDAARIAQFVGHPGEQSGNVCKITVGRADLHLSDMGAPINARMGLNTWAAFIGSDRQAAVAGDVAMLESEVQPVLKALCANDLDVVSIHQHMLGTQPTNVFLPYWGTGPAARLAAGFKAALQQLGKTSAGPR
jgi:hypothetical protein